MRQARAACDFLIVAINSDASVRRLKGPQRPVQNHAARADILSALDMVDMVIVFEEDTPLALIKEIKTSDTQDKMSLVSFLVFN